jgi:hypothetical protein
MYSPFANQCNILITMFKSLLFDSGMHRSMQAFFFEICDEAQVD